MGESPIREFEIRNGDDGITKNRVIYFSNGALRENDPFGALVDPPTDEEQLYKRKVYYRELHLEIAKAEFDNLKTLLTMQAQAVRNGGGATPSQEQFDMLKQLQTIVKQRQEALAAARVLPPGMQAAEDRRKRFEQERHEAADRALEALNDITV